MGLTSPSLVAKGRRKKEKNQYLVILGMLAIHVDISFCASIVDTHVGSVHVPVEQIGKNVRRARKC